MKFGQRLKELRKDKKLTLRELAERAGVHFTYLSKIETGNLENYKLPSEDLIRKLSHILGDANGELLILAGKVPSPIVKLTMRRPAAMLALAALPEDRFDKLVAAIL